MKRTNTVTLACTILVIALLALHSLVHGQPSRSRDHDPGTQVLHSGQSSHTERAEERRQRAVERRHQAMAAERERLSLMRRELQQASGATGSPLSSPGRRSSGAISGLTPAFTPGDRSLSIDGDFDLGPTSNISKVGRPWLWDDGTGNLGVGLQALASTTSAEGNTAVGYYALFGTSEGSWNAALGYSALSQNQTGDWNSGVGNAVLQSNTSGRRNSALGNQALPNNTTGSSNVAVGDTALYYTDGASIDLYGSYNTAVGGSALFSNTTGSFNVAVGRNALFANIDGSRLTAVGESALASNTTVVDSAAQRGFGNSAFGSDALRSNTTGIWNTATGSKALQDNVTGSSNTANGYGALQSNKDVVVPGYGTYSGGSNSAFGFNALLSNTSGSNNTAVGAHALQDNSTGSYNTAVGLYALESSNGSFNIAVGSDAGAVTPPVGSSNIFIGNGGVSGESYTIRIGNQPSGMPEEGQHSRAFLAGVYGATVPGQPVCVDSNAQLGECPPPGLLSSRRFKQGIQEMGDRSRQLLELQPVVFRFKGDLEEASRGIQFGLIAEDVARVLPQLVEYDGQGEPYAVRYALLTPLLLNELQNQRRLLREQGEEIARLRKQVALLTE